MKRTICQHTKITAAIAMCVALNQAQPAMAGWTGAMNGTGFGQAGVNVLAANGTSKASAINPTNYQNPSAAITINTNYITSAKLPKEASSATVAKVKGSSGYIWDATTVGSNGDSTDNAELESRITIIPADCASVQMLSLAEIDEVNKIGTITVNVKGTAGTAIWLRGYELLGGQVPPADDLSTTNNEFIDFLKANGTLKWDVLNVGPMDQDTNNCSALKIPFSYETSITNLYSVSDGVAKSLPLEISKPVNVTVECNLQPATYPGVNVYGCTNSGPITVTYDPPAGTYFPVGVSPVTVTAKDSDGNEKSTNFTVTVTDTKPPTPNVTSLPDVTGQCTATITVAPTATDTCSGTITGTTTNALTRTTQGTSIVTWKFDDGQGNISTQTQKIIVKDTIAPVPPVLTTVVGSLCQPVTLTAPQATDNCAGLVTGTTTTVFPITKSGTTVVTWNFNDGNGNSSTSNQTVVVKALEFEGFFSPINGVGGSYASPVLTNIKRGSVVPVKFETECEGEHYRSAVPGIPKMSVLRYTSATTSPTNPQPVAGGGNFKRVGTKDEDDWHFDWDTTGLNAGVYQIIATLQDGTTKTVFVQIKP